MNTHDLLQQALDALKSIASIENKYIGHDWGEIEEARNIANSAISAIEAAKAQPSNAVELPAVELRRYLQHPENKHLFPHDDGEWVKFTNAQAAIAAAQGAKQ